MPLPILLPILGALLGGGSIAGGMMSRKSEATGEDAGLLGRLFPDTGVQARQQERIQQQQQQLMADRAWMEEDRARTGALGSLLGTVPFDQRSELLARTQGAQTGLLGQMSQGDLSTLQSKPQAQMASQLATAEPWAKQYQARAVPIQEQLYKNNDIIGMLNTPGGSGLAEYGAAKVWIQALDDSMVRQPEMREAFAGSGIVEGIKQIVGQAAGDGYLTEPQKAELARLVEQGNARLQIRYQALNEYADQIARQIGVEPTLIKTWNMPIEPARYRGGSSGEPAAPAAEKPDLGPRGPKTDALGRPIG